MKKIGKELVKFVGAVVVGGATFALLAWIYDMTIGHTPDWLCYTSLAVVAYACAVGAELATEICGKTSEWRKTKKEKEISEIAMQVARILKDEKIEP